MFQTSNHTYYDNLTRVGAVGLVIKPGVMAYACYYACQKAKRINIVVNRLYNKMEDEKVQQQVSSMI